MIRRFNRYELKYLLPVEKKEAITRDLLEMTVPDEYGKTKGYRVVSLYYDSPDLDFFWAKIEGIKFRRKLRIRVYAPEDQAAIEKVELALVEIKQRINRTVQKRRVKLPMYQAEELCGGAGLSKQDFDPLDRQVVSEVHYMVRAMHLKPTCVTAYRRQAFVGSLYDAGLRITFDTDLRYRVKGLKVNQNAPNHMFLPPDWSIMEVKVNEAVPNWVTSLLARHGCQLGRISKYCTGLAAGRGMAVLPQTLLPLARSTA